MIKKEKDLVLTIKENIAVGKGKLQNIDIFLPEEMLGKARKFSKMIIPAGASIGRHAHDTDAEVYYVLKGEIVVTDNDKTFVLRQGEAMWTSQGDTHSVENKTNADAEFLAIIMN